MIKVRNIATGEVINISQTGRDKETRRIVTNGTPSAKFLAKYPLISTGEKNAEGDTFMELKEGFELVTRQKRTNQNTPKPQPKPKAEPKNEPKAETTNDANDAKPEQTAETANTPTTTETADNIDETARAIAEALRAAKVNAPVPTIDEAAVEAIVRRVIAEQPKNEPKAANTVEIKIVGTEQTGRVNNPHPLLKKVLALVVNDRVTGRYPWLFGPAGSGKSTLAKQVADALNLPFYSVSSLQQKYELEGYTDATGKLVETVFYKAAKEGGVFLFDEASTTSGEVQVAWNSMLANLWYNFPKEGMIKAHPDFHVIAADNTTGRGGNSTYSARFQMDASTLDRYTPIQIDYTDEQDNNMSENDADLVAFIRDLRKAIADARLTYTASPRALRAIKAHQKMNVFSDVEAFELGLCSGWNKQDVKTLAARLSGTNKYYKYFREIANRG